MIPNDSMLNRGAGSRWTEMEREWANALDSGDDITIAIEVVYDSADIRPDRFIVNYSVNNIPQTPKTFENIAGG